MLEWIDSHCHYDFEVFEPQRLQHWQWCQTLGLMGLLIPGVSLQQSQALQTLCASQTNWWHAVGLHPYFIDQHRPEHLDALVSLARQSHCVAIGEFGLDYVLAKTDEQRQQQWWWFDQQLQLAHRLNLPVVLHVRKAHDQVAQRLRQRQFTAGGLVHGFSGSVQQAKAYLDCGLALGLGGAVTHPRAQKLRQSVSKLPANAWLLETDAPDMTPAFLASGNTPAMIPLIAQILARLKRQSLAQIAAQNQQLFHEQFKV